jgi:hypothetical protein
LGKQGFDLGETGSSELKFKLQISGEGSDRVFSVWSDFSFQG